MSRVDAEHLWKIYQGGIEAVRDANFHVEVGEFVAILGPSGCGKSSTLRMIVGLEDITRGELLFDGKIVNHLSPRERNVALAFETYALYYPLTIYENLAFPLRAIGMTKTEVNKKVKEIAEMFDLSDVLEEKPTNLSGGEQQRVSLARALIRDPNVTLLDEPLSHMDQRVRVILRATIRHIHNRLRLTTIYVTHDQEEAISLADRIIVMNEGIIQQIGTVDDLWNQPTNKFVAGFLGEPAMNFIAGRIEKPLEISVTTRDGKYALRVNTNIEDRYIGSEVTVGIRPEKIIPHLNKKDNCIPSLLEVIEPLGETKILTVKLDGTELKVVTSQDIKIDQGQVIWLEFDSKDIHAFHRETETTLTESPRASG